ncbi:MAG: hypothetical protein ACKOE6_17250, partial [Flammeovirgaceae bacterium]
MLKSVSTWCVVLCCAGVQAQVADPLIKVVEEEMAREWGQLQKAQQPPYFLSYRITDNRSFRLRGSLGSLVDDNKDRVRILSSQVRVGDYSFDDSHPTDDFNQDMPFDLMDRGARALTLPEEDDALPIQFAMWQQTQSAYRSALSTYKALKNAPKKEEKKPVNDFSIEEPAVFIDG